MLVKPGRDEQPHLIQHKRHRQHDAQIQADIDYQRDVTGRAGEIQLVVKMRRAQRVLHRLHQDHDEMLRRPAGPMTRAYRDRNGGIDQPFAQIEEVLEKRHASASVVFGGRQKRLDQAGRGRPSLTFSVAPGQDGQPDWNRERSRELRRCGCSIDVQLPRGERDSGPRVETVPGAGGNGSLVDSGGQLGVGCIWSR